MQCYKKFKYLINDEKYHHINQSYESSAKSENLLKIVKRCGAENVVSS